MKRLRRCVAVVSTASVTAMLIAVGCMSQRVPEGDPEGEMIADTEGEALSCSYETCGHPKCSVGTALIHPACDPCVQNVCNEEGLCCGMHWDQLCVDLVQALCAVSCDEGYQIQVKSTGQCLSTPSPENTSGVYLTGCASAANQRFFLSYVSDGLYNVVAGESGLCLTPDPWAHSNLEPQILQFDCFPQGMVYVISVGSGYYLLVDKFTGFCYETTSAGGALRQSECDGESNQKFRFYAKK